VLAVLEEQGLVTREGDAEDRRVCWVTLTDSGREVLERTANERNVWLAGCLETLDPHEREVLAEAVVVLQHLVSAD
jgi:DNA-binding MarR family transcriptional regulator